MVSLQLGEYPVYKKTERDVRAHPAISHYSHLLLKCRVATNMSHKLKVQSRRFKNYIFAKKCILNQLFGLMNLLLLFLHTLLFCHILLFRCWIFFQPGCQTFWIHIRPDILSVLIWVQTLCKGYQQTTRVAPRGQRVKYKTTF